MIAAGILLQAPDGTVLLLKESDGDVMPGAWVFPGGKLEGDETTMDAALRETQEETGLELDAAGQVHMRQVSGDVDYTTYRKVHPEAFVPVLSDEHVAFAWMTPEVALQEPNLHPGVRVALMRLTMDELGLAQAIARGDIASPQKYENMWLYAMRITGTGVSYRRAINEFVYRRPENYLTTEFLQRCNGLPVILMHPKKAIMDSKEFSDRVVGTMLWPYIQGDEVWGVAKIYDADTVTLLQENKLSTSPSVLFRDPKVNSKMTLEDGSTLLIEGKPSLLDHLAICENGVWDKGEEPNGIRADSTGEHAMSEEEDKAKKDAEEAKAREDKAKADAAKADGDKMDKVLAACDAISTRFDAFEKRMDAFEAKKDSEYKKDDDPMADKAKKDAEEEEKKKADKAKKDAEEEEEKKKSDKAKKDAEEEEEKRKADSAETRRLIADVAARLPKPMSDADYSALADAQARADDVFNAFGMKASRPQEGETVLGYRRRIAKELKVHSPHWKEVDLELISDDKAFDTIEKQVYADAVSASRNPVDLGAGELREVISTDRVSGRRTTTFRGKNTFIKSMSRVRGTTDRINLNPGATAH